MGRQTDADWRHYWVLQLVREKCATGIEWAKVREPMPRIVKNYLQNVNTATGEKYCSKKKIFQQ